MATGLQNGTRSYCAALALATLAIVLLASLLPDSAPAATRSFSPVAVQRSVAIFRPRHVAPQAVSSARLTLGARAYPVSPATVRSGIRSGSLRISVPRHYRPARRASFKLRVTLKSRSRKPRSPETSPTSSEPTPTSEPTTEPTTPSEPTTEPTTPSEPTTEPAPETTQPIEIPANARYVSPTGSDSASGSATSPWRTVSKAASTAGAGDVVVLEPGTYGAMGTITDFSRSGTAGAPIVFTSDPGKQRAVLRGYAHITASHLRLNSIVFDGPTGAIVAKSSSNPNGEEVQVSIMGGADVEVSHSEVRENAWHAGIFVSKASNVRLVSNYVHDNGDAATGANLDHGIYWCSGSGSIVNNTVAGNVAYGIQLYPTAANVLVSHNTVTGNRRGGIIVSREAAGNEILNNLVANNAEYGIRSYELTGTGNVARNNLLWNNPQNTYGTGISFSGTVVSNPQQMSSTTLAAYGAS
jgi:parallel beta-helix repeat protein